MRQISELLRKELDRFLTREMEFPSGCLVTIEEVTTSRDLSYTTVSVSVLPSEQRQKVVALLNAHTPEMHRLISARIQFRKMPRVRFIEDTREETAERIHRLLDGKPPDG